MDITSSKMQTGALKSRKVENTRKGTDGKELACSGNKCERGVGAVKESGSDRSECRETKTKILLETEGEEGYKKGAGH